MKTLSVLYLTAFAACAAAQAPPAKPPAAKPAATAAKPATPAQPAATQPAAAKPAAAAKPVKKSLTPAALTDTAPALFKARFTTTKGEFVVTAHRDWAPIGVDRFYNLVKYGFYDGCAFFRVMTGFVVQFGINGNPAVQARWQNANIKDDPVKESNKLGYVTFATAGPNTRTTQLFINLANNRGLDSQGFAPIGEVTEGFGVTGLIYSGYGQRPDQGQIVQQGTAYLKKSFPELTYITKATIE